MASAAAAIADYTPWGAAVSPRHPARSAYYFVAGEGRDAKPQFLPDLGAARAHALRMASELLWDCPYRLQARPEWTIKVTDEAGSALFSVSLTEALAAELEAA